MSENIIGNAVAGITAPTKVTAADGHEYHKSSSANATVAPTNEGTLAKIGQGLSKPTLEFVTIVDYEWNLTAVLNLEKLREYGYSDLELKIYFEDADTLKALEDRGISPKVIQAVVSPVTTKNAKLTPLQLLVANKLLDLTDNRSSRKKLQDHGVTTTQYAAWQRDPEFSGYLQQRAEAMLGDTQHEAMLALMDRVNARDMSAIKYYHELTGRFIQQGSNQSGNSAHDLQTIIVRIIEIIIDNVSDDGERAAIVGKLEALALGNAVATSNIPGPVEVPQIAVARPITAEVQHLMDQGLGYDG